jgi:hypothetical protein
MIDSYEDLKEIFTDNFKGTYMWSSNPWDLKGCRQKLGESLGITFGNSPGSAMCSPRSATLTSSQHSS